ncbi:Ribose import ATP-binding protein RbsA [Baekduia alba]|uniref:ATP-binding cassette domain-containing protein n=1 Tax=Baekduia alba TaxID=2997333 RepID=UPI002340C4DF|nr:sugar ABC transporter ATP-binding protein [Baekduia alba]WCB93410.1 Ribose import ATP-binding protein RbsA [Baekduia alba]
MSGGVDAYVEATDVHLSFGSVHALRGASIRIPKGAVEGLVGHNGAGKSTLISVICGAQVPDAGSLVVRGAPLRGGSVAEAEERGVVLVPQRTSLFEELTVLDNLLIPRRFPIARTGTIAWSAARAAARAALAQVRLEVDLDARVTDLTVPERRALMIARALLRRPRLLILDEPTEAFTEGEVARLFETLRAMIGDGLTVLYVSHRLDEVLDLAGHVTIMRDGATVGRVAAGGVDRRALVGLMLGEEAPAVARLERRDDLHARRAGTVLALHDVRSPALHGVDLRVGAGEVVGLYGLAGAGRSEILRVVAGLRPATGGTVELHGAPLEGTVGQRRSAGVSLLSADVAGEGALPGLTVRENVAIGVAGGVRTTRRAPFVSRARETIVARAALEEVGLDPGRLEAPVETLSGGMQQKVMLARSLVGASALWLLDEPMTGLDVHSRVELAALLRRLVGERRAAAAAAVPRGALVVLSEFEDLTMMCDRVYAVRDGRIVAEYHAGEFDEPALVHAVSFERAA